LGQVIDILKQIDCLVNYRCFFIK